MKEKNNNQIHQIYVASKVMHYNDVIEIFEQYSTFGSTKHHIYVSKRKVLVYSKMIDEKEVFYLASNNKKIKEKTFKSSWNSNTPCGIYGSYYENYDNEINNTLYGYFVPIEEYAKKDKKINSLLLARGLLTIKNTLSKKFVKLSFDEENASKQLSKLGYTK